VRRLFVKTPAGRQRLNVLAALNAVTRDLVSVANTSYVTAHTVCDLLTKLAARHGDVPITVVLDNARYQRCGLVQQTAAQLQIELLFLPPYSPNLNLIERFWKFVKKKVLYGKYYATHTAFEQAILDCIASAATQYPTELATLLSLNFQTFDSVPILGELVQGSQVPIDEPSEIEMQEVLSMAA
jgi:transposase